ncbi:hypothetical protein FF124_07620 [Martelella lutilitoris]|uniref:Uncharacterized protein n=1 Tax=Martelella lutilitoris TaxID=2583532 RepID=A0A5C4JSE7_9HYPH|nr:hypothetical protein [Martelella lutilitoris]TNB48197.1 hypothetical protein FF124_07620 [Martelella lutilitoris]
MEIDWTQFRQVAQMSVDASGRMTFEVTDPEAAKLEQALYVWQSHSGQILRFGTTKSPVSSRLRQYPNHINRRLVGQKSPTPEWEAKAWVDYANKGPVVALVHQPPQINSVIGPIRPYLDLERELIAAFKPPLNRSHR